MKNRISRRDFLHGTALSLTAAALAACAQATPAPTEAPTEAPTAEVAPTEAPTEAPPAEATAAPTEAPTVAPTEAGAQPQYGGTYRRYASGFRAFDPPGAEIYGDWWSVGIIIGNTLYTYTAAGELLPELAADFPEMSDDGLIYKIPLRQGVKFHNGREMVADDVKFSLERSL